MNMRAFVRWGLITSAVLVGLALALPTWTLVQSDGIIVNNADATLTLGMTSNATLTTVIGNVSPRFVLQYASGMKYYALGPISTTLQTVLGQVGPRFVLQSANGLKYYALGPMSTTLQTVLGQVGPRFVLQYANASRAYALQYPAGLLGDTTPPQITSPITVTAIATDSVKVSWRTNEFAASSITYGVQSGVYTQTTTDALYYTLHEMTLTGLTNQSVYYYRITNADQSGNSAQTAEATFKFVSQQRILLPYIRR